MNGLALDIEADGIGLKPVDIRALRGILDTPPFKWDGTNPSLARQCGPRLSVFFSRLDPPSPADLAALVRFVGTIEQPVNPRRAPEGSRRRSGAENRCSSDSGTTGESRSPPHRDASTATAARTGPRRGRPGVGTEMWFDSPAVDVPAIDLHDEDSLGPLGIVYFSQDPSRLRPLDNPHLRGIRSSPPYLHNGAAATLEEIWTRFNVYEWHGRTGDLTRRQFNDLIEYLKTL